MLVPFLVFLLAFAAPPVPTTEAPAVRADAIHDLPAATWRASGLVTPDGALRVLPGWRVRVGPRGRASLAGPAPRAPHAAGSWDDAVEVGDVRVAVRVAARDHTGTYVEGRLRRGGQTRAFVLRWSPATGIWSDAVSAL